ncbi:MFS transporter [Serratia sp. UGAL515B_01]|uniref:MFS transporter n=1 Tax=Serratia sp. UGAL515B_01 TaxID=2986763 RepID=UPI002954A29B|nr:MFS transporter [Serratia sp. UGAL515B_01]WON77973.1 MFS transporter [Serratia sp. UGAL515B_01]
MIQIALLLFGLDFVRSRAKYLVNIGIIWGVLGIGIFIDGLDGVAYFPLHVFGILLLLESLVTLSIASSGVGAQKVVLYFKGGVFCFVAILILSNRSYSDLLLAIIFGFAYFVIGLFVIASAWIVRFPHWKSTLLSGIGQILFAVLMFSPYPIHYKATVSAFLGTLMFFSAVSTVKLARRVNRLREGTSVFELLAPADIANGFEKMAKPLQSVTNISPDEFSKPLTVHIWTPEGTANTSPIPRPVINRYIAAVDSQGVISTGHAALELPPSIYISLYPEADIDRSPSEFLNTLKATKDNDVPGVFQPDYATEAANWCDSDRKIQFYEYNSMALLRFWNVYRCSKTYNLTYRNCSSSVAYALEASLDGVLSKRRKKWLCTLRMLVTPELWIAAQLRKRALSMAWTPGLVMDYARALQSIVNPDPQSWFQRALSKWDLLRKAKK